jgi:uncharacterized protein (TIGR03000 family)
MYSLVLMMALTPSADTPAGLFNKGCCGGTSCSGCSGSCCGGYSCSGCCGASAKHCIFGGRSKSCHGCSGCHGSSCHGCTGCCGGSACTGCTGGCGGMAAPAPAPAPKPEAAPAPKPAAMAAPATIVVTLPVDAKLTIDGAATRSTSNVRTFVTPTLEVGQEFSYTLKAEVVRDGQTFSNEQRVTVRAGLESKINITVPVTSASAQ